VIRRRQLGIAVTVAAAGLAVLLASGRAPVLDTSHDRPRLPVAVTLGHTQRHPLTVTAYAAWAGAQDRFTNAARALGRELDACRMHHAAFHSCVQPAVSTLGYEADDVGGMTATFERRGGPCGRALHTLARRLDAYSQAAEAFMSLRHAGPAGVLARLQANLQAAREAYALAVLQVRGQCRPG
jgi:hypothetical protein